LVSWVLVLAGARSTLSPRKAALTAPATGTNPIRKPANVSA
jgi:hypothetical protein